MLTGVKTNSLSVWSMITIFYQTFLCVIFSWVTLSCKLSPKSTELHEVTLIKLLYLYDPEACGRIHFYNYTIVDVVDVYGTAVVWPVKNDVASSFRGKLQLWLCLHLFWSALAVINITQVARPCGFYVTLLPFTITGVSILVVDLVYCALFLIDATKTETESQILQYIDAGKKHVHSINSTLRDTPEGADTSWVAVLFAYASVRGVVQWLVNYWIVKDSYIDGLALYHNLQQTNKDKTEMKSSQMTEIYV